MALALGSMGFAALSAILRMPIEAFGTAPDASGWSSANRRMR
jgi:hypothetical protein